MNDVTKSATDDPLTRSIEEMMADPERRARLMKAADLALQQKITDEFKWSLPSTVSDVCTKFIEEEVAPEVLKHLMTNKGVIVSSAIEAADQIGAHLAEELVKKAVSNLSGYRMSSIAKEIFG